MSNYITGRTRSETLLNWSGRILEKETLEEIFEE